MDKLLVVNIQGGRKVSGYLRGFDIFLNVVIDEAREEATADKTNCGTVVSWPTLAPPPARTVTSHFRILVSDSVQTTAGYSRQFYNKHGSDSNAMRRKCGELCSQARCV